MSDHIPAPNIKNMVRVGEFTLTVYAYRPLTREELTACAAQWLRQENRKKFPTRGSAEMLTIFGFDQV